MAIPLLLYRDLWLLGGHAIAFVLLLAARLTGESATLVTEPLWWIAVAAPPLWSMVVFCYYEFVVIEDRDR